MGDLTLTVIKGIDLKPPSVFSSKSSMQCYCRIRVGSNYNWDGKVYKTKVSPHKTNNPEWRSTFSISIKNPTKYYIRILVKDKLSLMDKLIGEAMFPLGDSSLLRDQENIITVPIKKAGGVKGQLMLSVIPHTFGTAQNTVTVVQHQQQPTIVHQTVTTTNPPPPPQPTMIAPPPSDTYNPYPYGQPGNSVPPPNPDPYGTNNGNPYGTTVPPPQNGNPYGTNPYGTVPPQQNNPYGNPPPQNNSYGNPPPNNNAYGQSYAPNHYYY